MSNNSTIDMSSVYELKQFMINELAPKYFDLSDVNQFNVGLLGYTTEGLAVTTEESFNAMNTMYKEYFITKAVFPETIYAEAGILGIDDIAAIPSTANAVVFVKKDDIINKGHTENNVTYFDLDKDTKVDVDGISYSLDYPISIVARPDKQGDYIITAQYDMVERNAISTLSHPYIKIHRATVTGVEYVGLFLKVNQFVRTETVESLITSNNINFPVIDVNYNDMYAGMDVFYTDPTTSTETRLQLKVQGSPPLKTPFIYYEHVDNGMVRLSFTTRDNYFRPEFNSDLRVVIYSTIGAGGNFKSYTGSNINVVNNADTSIQYKNGMPVMFAAITGSSIGGKNIQTIEELRTSIIEKKASSGAYNTETDLEQYFNGGASELEGSFLKFIKRRDDLIERLFSCFGLFKEDTGNYYPTNTLNMRLTEDDFDLTYDNGNRMIVRPGQLFTYDKDSKDTIVRTDTANQPFVYANPFLISLQKTPNSITYYNNSIDETIPMDYKYNDVGSKYQFIINNLSVYRNAIIGQNEYTFRVNLKPNFELTFNDDGEPVFEDDMKVVLSFEEDGNDTKAIIMDLVEYNPTDMILSFESVLQTDDEINRNSKMVINNLYDVNQNTFGYETVPMMDAILNVSILFNTPGVGSRYNPFSKIAGLEEHNMVSKYSTESNPITLIQPMKHIRSRVNFTPFTSNGEDSYYMTISLSPVVGQSLAKDDVRLMSFLEDVNYTYDYIDRIMEKKTNNYSIDIKFYNTYGKSNNFIVDEAENRLDRVNLNFRIQAAFEFGAILEDAIYNIQQKIKQYIENINTASDANVASRGFNGIYVSNLIQQIENEFPIVRYMKFKNINDYESSIQVVENRTVDVSTLSAVERRSYVPEFLTINTDNITVDIL